MSFDVRLVEPDDVAELTEVINGIIAKGGTTAFEQPFEPEAFAGQYLIGPQVLCAFVAIDPVSRRPEGFQILGDFGHPVPDDWGDIGTYVRVDGKQRGVGTALFSATRERAENLGLTAINATIRADNDGGLAYYSKLGFQDYALDRSVPLADGRPVDRVHKRYSLNAEINDDA
ncbi:MAG TPA: GNAT family protein [Sphingomicrobium sp.]|nr:GNAT family protein [Sphingomicrobium sp.]